MSGNDPLPEVKRTSALRRIPIPQAPRFVRTPGYEGDVCAFELFPLRGHPIVVEDIFGRAMTLLPGDVLLTGTPEGVGKLAAGDVVEVEVDGIGPLINPVRA